MMRLKTLAAALILLGPGIAPAADCKHSAPRALQLDLDGVTSVRFDVGAHNLRIGASKGDEAGIDGKACSSDADKLDTVTLRQRRIGSELRVELRSDTSFRGGFFGKQYGYLDVAARLPAALPIAVELGSGDVEVRDMGSVNVDMGSGDLLVSRAGAIRLSIGSGDAEIETVAGEVRVEVGSGDVVLRDAGSLLVTRLGSGDLNGRDIRGDVLIEQLGSGDIELAGIGGSVEVEDIGSGDLSVEDVAGDLRVDDIGSGDVDHRRIAGRVSLPEN